MGQSKDNKQVLLELRKKNLRQLVETNADLADFLCDYLTLAGFFNCGYDPDPNKAIYLNGARHAVLMLLDGMGYSGDKVLKFKRLNGDSDNV